MNSARASERSTNSALAKSRAREGLPARSSSNCVGEAVSDQAAQLFWATEAVTVDSSAGLRLTHSGLSGEEDRTNVCGMSRASVAGLGRKGAGAAEVPAGSCPTREGPTVLRVELRKRRPQGAATHPRSVNAATGPNSLMDARWIWTTLPGVP